MISRGLFSAGMPDHVIQVFQYVAKLDATPKGCYASARQIGAALGLTSTKAQQALHELASLGALIPGRGRQAARWRVSPAGGDLVVLRAGWTHLRGTKIAYPGKLLDARIPDQAVRVYAHVAEWDRTPEGCFRKDSTMAQALALHVDTVNELLAVLQNMGILRRSPVGRKGWKIAPFHFDARDGGYALAPHGIENSMPARHLRAWLVVARHLRLTTTSATASDVQACLVNMDRGGKGPGPVSRDTTLRTLRDLVDTSWLTQTYAPGEGYAFQPHMFGSAIEAGTLTATRKARTAAGVEVMRTQEELAELERLARQTYPMPDPAPAPAKARRRAKGSRCVDQIGLFDLVEEGGQDELEGGLVDEERCPHPQQPDRASGLLEEGDPQQPDRATPSNQTGMTPSNQTVLRERQYGGNCSVEKEREIAGVGADLSVPREKEDQFFDEEGTGKISAGPDASSGQTPGDEPWHTVRQLAQQAGTSATIRARALERARVERSERARGDRTA